MILGSGVQNKPDDPIFKTEPDLTRLKNGFSIMYVKTNVYSERNRNTWSEINPMPEWATLINYSRIPDHIKHGGEYHRTCLKPKAPHLVYFSSKEEHLQNFT